jgi:hypothetical protein
MFEYDRYTRRSIDNRTNGSWSSWRELGSFSMGIRYVFKMIPDHGVPEKCWLTRHVAFR